ncbi:hypothetical protein EDD36DRAFT_467097 [Exophiala viscosa]|uniref:DUF6594 domain-containing protein n=1 Tax=Exophiala viscosa TaxID=2486360 RepID=A0AAN6DQQ9_9EURO|nr:hypothetical protein EDD36DRAFT_467097 [Exophiala viscosa]
MEGYDSLSALMGKYPELAIFRKYSTLNCRNLLLMQAELAEKQGRLLSIIAADRESKVKARASIPHNFTAMMENTTEGGSKQREMMMDIRQLLKEYGKYEGLLRYRQIEGLPSVHKSNLKHLREVLRHMDFQVRREWAVWGEEEHEYDMTSLIDAEGERDTLSQWLAWCVSHPYHRLIGGKIHPRLDVDEAWRPALPLKLTYYSNEHIAKVVTILTTILAPVLPTSGAIVLYFIDNQLIRLGVIVILGFFFSAALTLLGTPRRIDSFAATATFIAVLIVFVGNGTGCAC